MQLSTLKQSEFIEHEGESFVSIKTLIEDAKFPLVFAPLSGGFIPVKLRRLNSIQIKSCGDFSLIETLYDTRRKDKEPSLNSLKQYKKLQHEVVKLSLVSPSYDEIVKILEADEIIVKAKTTLQELRKELESLPDGTRKKTFMDEICIWEMWAEFILPDDFLSYIFRIATSQDISDIKLITSEILLNAAILAEKGHDNPHNHIEGNFTDFNLTDIDMRAWLEYAKYKERNSKK
ncbi:MAG: hypothetical protein OEV44_01345 [Spirochaetota bacterium]|nr:hypothetical protein [Spirochaetota bacterium]